LSKVQQQRDEAMKEINQAMAVRIKATKDMARLTEERNAAVQEYSLIMSERDSVHKEIEKLQEEHSEMLKRSKSLENDKKVMLEEIESLKREIASALFDRDRVLKACNDLREKYGDYVTGINDEVTSPTSPSRSAHNFWGSSSSGVSSSWAQVMSKSTNSDLIKSNHMSAASSNSSVSTFSHQQNKLCSNTRLDNIDQANTEIESLRKQVERLQTDLVEAQQEVEVCKRRRDWAFSERDKIVLERESIRTLCDKLRRERDRAVSDLAEALRDSDDIKRQRNEASKELKELKEKIEAQLEKESRFKAQQQQQQNSQFGTNNSSRDSAIDADLQEFEIETIDVLLKKELKGSDWGFKISCDEKALFVANVVKDSVADGKVKVNDCLIKINDTLMTNDLKVANELLKKSELQLNLTVQRKKATRFVQTINYSVDNGQEHGIVLESGYYVSRINAGSVAAKEGNLAIGDRVLYINGKSIDGISSYDVMQTLHSSSNIILQIMKNSINVCTQPNGNSSNVNNSKTVGESNDSKSSHQRERQRKMVSMCSQTDDSLSLPPRPPVPLDYQSLSRTTGKRNSAIISATNKGLITSFSNSSTSSSPGNDVTQTPAAPTLLDKAYNKIFGDRKQTSKPKQQMQGFCEDESKTLAELDKVLDKYSGGKSGKYSKISKSKKEKNGGTWPKYKGHPPAPSLQIYGNVNAVTTLHPIKRKERKSLGIFANSNFKSEKVVPTSGISQSSTTNAEPKQSSNNNMKEERMTPSSFLIFEPASEAALIDYHHHSKRNSTLSSRSSNTQTLPLNATNNQKILSPTYSSASSSSQSYNSAKKETLDLKIYRPLKPLTNSPLDYSVVSAQTKDKNVLDYYKHRANVKQIRPHSVHDVLTDARVVSESLSPTTLSLTGDQSYDSFHANASSPTPTNVPIPPIRNSAAFAYYALNNISHPQTGLLHVHHNHFATNSHITRGTPQTAIRHSTNSPHSLISPYISRSGDSLLSGNEHQLHSHDLSHSRSVSAYQGNGRHYTVKDNLVNRYSITPSPSPSQYSGLFGGPSPSHSMDIVTSGANGAHFHNLQSKRMVAPQHTHQSHLHHSSITSNNGYRSDENNFGISSIDGLSTFPKRNQRFRIPSNPSVTSKSSGGKLSTSSIDKASSSILSDRGSPMPCSYHVDWLSPHSGSSDGSDRTAKAGDVRNIYIERSSAPLGIQINCDTQGTGGVFVSQVNENSLAALAGLLVGDQLLEICGINMRNANYTLAANVLRQCGDTIRMLVQYNPDKYKETEEADSDDADVDEDEDMEDEDEDDTGPNDSTSTSTPQSSPIEHTAKAIIVRTNTNPNEDENIPSSATSTLTRSKAASRSASNASRNTEKTLTNYSISERQSSNSFKQSSNACEPRRIVLKKMNSNLGIKLFGGNAVGIFIHSIRDDSLANGPNGLKPGDQILEVFI
jgi:C-terminal processing protease CtpA/Prc